MIKMQIVIETIVILYIHKRHYQVFSIIEQQSFSFHNIIFQLFPYTFNFFHKG
jgi:hypothetical protein